MTFSSKKACRKNNRTRRAFTLLEVVVGMMLMAALVVGSLASLSRYRSSLASAARSRYALSVADQLLDQWLESSSGLPGAAVGVVAQDSTLQWRTRIVSRRLVCNLPIEIVRLDVFEFSRESSDATTLATVEYVRRASVRRGPQ